MKQGRGCLYNRPLTAESRTQMPGRGKSALHRLDPRCPLRKMVCTRRASQEAGWHSGVGSPEPGRRELSLTFLPGITLPVWLIPKGSRRFSLLQPNSLVPISPSEQKQVGGHVVTWGSCQGHTRGRAVSREIGSLRCIH